MTSVFKGSGTALITPFNADYSINFEAFARQIEFQITNKTDALVFLGTTGEPATMNEDEQKAIIKFAVKTVKNRAKVIIGTGSNCTASAVRKSKVAEDLGADAILCVTPYYNKCTQKGLFEYYKQINDNINIPFITYNVPSRTGVNILPQTAERLVELSNIAGIKEASGNMEQVLDTARRIQGKMPLYSGEDALNYPILTAGADGVISVVSNVLPGEVKMLTELVFNGEMQKAINLSHKLFPVSKAMFVEVNPIPVKAGVSLIGLDGGYCRSPLTEIEEDNLKTLRKALSDFGVKL